MKKTHLALVGLFALAVATSAFAHSGGLDADGGHMDKEKGSYHFHQNAKGEKLGSPVEAIGHKQGEKYMGATVSEGSSVKAEKKEKKAKKSKAEKAEKKAVKEAKEEAKPEAAEAKTEKKEKKGKKAKKEKKGKSKD